MHLITIFSLLSTISLLTFSVPRLLEAETQPVSIKVQKSDR